MWTGELILLGIALGVLLLAPTDGALWLGGGPALLGALLLPLLAFGVRRLLVARAIARTASGDEPTGDPAHRLRHLGWLLRVVDASDLLLYAGLVHGLGLLALCRTGLGGVPVAGPTLVDLAALLPFVLARLAGHLGGAPRRVVPSASKRRRLVTDPGRWHLVGLAIYGAIRGGSDLLGAAVSLRLASYRFPSIEGLGAAVLVIGLLVALPLVVRFLLPGRPLADGPHRNLVEEVLETSGVRVSEIWLWRTGPARVATAAIAGPLAPFRLLVLTDALVASLPPSDLVGVVGHEAGHVRRGHLALLAGLALALVLCVGTADLVLTAATGPGGPSLVVALGVLGAVVLTWILLFGFLSRRLEIEADLEGARTVGSLERYIGILQRVIGQASPGSESGFRHFKGKDRVALLHRLEDPDERRRTERRLGLLKGAAWTAIGLILCLGLGGIAWDLSRSETVREVAATRRAWLTEDAEACDILAVRAAELASADPEPLLWGALAAAELGRDDRARERLAEARRRVAAAEGEEEWGPWLRDVQEAIGPTVEPAGDGEAGDSRE